MPRPRNRRIGADGRGMIPLFGEVHNNLVNVGGRGDDALGIRCEILQDGPYWVDTVL